MDALDVGPIIEMPLGTQDPSCGFCGRTAKEVRKLIAGPSDCICDECVLTCYDILDDEGLLPTEEELEEREGHSREAIEKELDWLKTLHESGRLPTGVYEENLRSILGLQGNKSSQAD